MRWLLQRLWHEQKQLDADIERITDEIERFSKEDPLVVHFGVPEKHLAGTCRFRFAPSRSRSRRRFLSSFLLSNV